MVKFHLGLDHLIIVLHKEFLIFTNKTQENTWKFLQKVDCAVNFKTSSESCIDCCEFSPCGKYFGVSFDKNILIYNTFEWNLLHIALGERKASCLCFFPKSNIILLGNKTGFTTFYSFEGKELSKVNSSLGHNSMLTSALITDNEKYIITSDRDEKIRITNYPNTYNIERFCLGHKQFVCWLGFLPSNKEVLISCSGDGTIKFWNYLNGSELAEYDCKSEINCKKNNEDNKVVIVKVACCELKSESILAVVEYKSNKVRILKVKSDSTNNLVIEFVDNLVLPCVPWDIVFCNQCLICLVPNKSQPLSLWSKDGDNFKNEQFQNINQYLIDNFDYVINQNKQITDVIPILFKRDIDNVQEYQKRKKARLLRTGKTA
ncbi:conserved hypothetical protein [Pediculus humanus corporis]|uniref:tRNA (guanine-N(7)-)-methyltransferase non-catalytic subunit wuho n=1 Tax=Pediculus humanus subsp. corporis TaxID=121224 RepID=E0VFQ1_PEDHC|nr:uncharacterized protein Phum_PHUM164090 [Pediculus humanus corporis]EEB12207.1 conserved hypothetical protein [Pediculus humanus corporis]